MLQPTKVIVMSCIWQHKYPAVYLSLAASMCWLLTYILMKSHNPLAHAQLAEAVYPLELTQAYASTVHAGCCDLPSSRCIASLAYTCRELWFRASLAWQQILGDQSGNRNTLLVAHNAVNQALVATAIGLPPTYFRRLLQNNAATTVLDFQPTKDGPPRVNLDRLNQVSLPTQVRNILLYNFSSICPW